MHPLAECVVPPIDYAAHPAYGALGRPTWSERARALRALLPKLVRFGVRYGVDSLQHQVAKRSGSPEPGDRAALRHHRALLEDGALSVELDSEQRARVRDALGPHLRRLEQRLAAVPLEQRSFLDAQLLLRAGPRSRLEAAAARALTHMGLYKQTDTAPDLFGAVEDLLRESGVLRAASAYRGRSLRVAYLAIQINDAGERFLRHHFTDLGLPDPSTTYMHVDTQYSMIKGILYLDDVGPEQGPFRYVMGSHRHRRSLAERVLRSAVDYAGLSARSPAARARFRALPRWLQRKADFGTDLAPGSPEVEALLAREHAFTTPGDGHLIVFDNDGIHRGALIERGRRRMLQIQLR